MRRSEASIRLRESRWIARGRTPDSERERENIGGTRIMENQGLPKWPGMARNAPVALSALYFLNLRGDVILERQYRDDVE